MNSISDRMIKILLFSSGLIAWSPTLAEFITVKDYLDSLLSTFQDLEHFFQKMVNEKPLLGKGPLALFYGGEDIVPLLSTDTSKSNNISIVIPFILSIGLFIFTFTYKKLRFKNVESYEQRLQTTVMSGNRNVFGYVAIFTAFFVFLGLLLVHHLALIKKEKGSERKDPAYDVIVLSLIGSIAILIPYVKNPKLR